LANVNGCAGPKRSPDGSDRDERFATHSAVRPRAAGRLHSPDDAQVESREVDVRRRAIALSQGVALLVGHERARLCRTTLSTPIGENSRLHGTTQEFSDDED